MISSVDEDAWLAEYRVDPEFSALFSPAGDLLDAASMHRGWVWMEELIRVALARTQEAVRNFHDGSTSGHWGTAKTLDLLARRFIFPRMRPIVCVAHSTVAVYFPGLDHGSPFRGL